MADLSPERIRIWRQLNEVRKSGIVNMVDYRGVMYTALELDFPELAVLTRSEYAAMLRDWTALEREVYRLDNEAKNKDESAKKIANAKAIKDASKDKKLKEVKEKWGK